MAGRVLCGIILLWIGFLAVLAGAWAQGPVVGEEYEIKAAYLYNFGLYVDWPKEAAGDHGSFVIGVLGKNLPGPYLAKIAATRTIKGKKIVISHFASADDYKPCHILFIPTMADGDREDTAEDRLAAVLKKIRGEPVLLVGESEGFAQKGGMINFYLDNNRVKFEINRDAAREQGLQISAQLLRVGRIVQTPKR
jgi:hypothetical protein